MHSFDNDWQHSITDTQQVPLVDDDDEDEAVVSKLPDSVSRGSKWIIFYTYH